MKKRIKIFQMTGILLILGSLAMMILFQINETKKAEKAREISRQLDEMIPQRNSGMLNYDSQMPVYEIENVDFVGLLEIPQYQVSLPVAAGWDEEYISTYPGRFSGSAYDNTLVVGGSGREGQLEVLSQLNQGDEIVFVDVTGTEFRYEAEQIDRAKELSAEDLYNPDYEFTIFARDMQSRDYIIIRCGI